MNPLQKALEARKAAQEALEKILELPITEGRALNTDEQTKFEEEARKIDELDAQIATLEAHEARKDKAAEAAAKLAAITDNGDVDQNGGAGDGIPQVRVLSEPMTYDEFGPHSYMRDMANIASQDKTGYDVSAERERFKRHAQEVEVEARTNPRIARQLKGVRADLRSNRKDAVTDFEKRINPNTTFGTGGEFVPPLWLENEYVPLQRPGRVFANRVTTRPLPGGIDVINIPKITIGTRTGIQPQQGAAVASQDFQTGLATAAVNTIAGQEDISMQLLEQSPLNMDGIIFDDLSADYDQQLDLQIIAGTGVNGQHKGVLTLPGATSNTNQQLVSRITVASATFFDAATTGTQYRSIVNGVNQIETLRYATPTGVWVHPRRANSWAYASDSQNRPLFIKAAYGPFQQLGIDNAVNLPQGMAGEIYGLGVWKDANMPTTMTGTSIIGGTADPIVILKEDDLILFEGTMRMRALPEVLSGTLQIRFQLYNYSAFIPDRLPAAISVLTGNTGLAAPGF